MIFKDEISINLVHLLFIGEKCLHFVGLDTCSVTKLHNSSFLQTSYIISVCLTNKEMNLC